MTTPPPRSGDAPDAAIIPEVHDALAAALRSRRSRTHAHSTRRRPLVVAGGFALTAAVVAIVLSVVLATSPSGGPVDVLGRAQAALAPHGDLVHYTVRVRHGVEVTGRGADLTVEPYPCNRPSIDEVWQATRPNRWRALTQSCISGDARRRYRTPDTHERSWVPGVSSSYDADRRRLDVVTGLSPRSSAGTVPLGLASIGPGDPIEIVRGLLAAGELEQHGTRRRNGLRVLTLTGRRTDSGHGITTLTRFVYDVDPDTYRPVRITIVSTSRPTDTTNRCGPRCRGLARPRGQRMDFETYERLPLNATTERLLTITPPKGTPVDRRTLTEARRATARRTQAAARSDRRVQRQREDR